MDNLKIPGFFEKIKFPKINFDSESVSVDIGSDWLKILQKNRAGNGRIVCYVKLLKLAQVKESIASAVRETFQLLKLNKQHVVACIPRHLITVRMLDLPATDFKEIRDMIDLQVGKQTPYAKEEIVFSHKIVETGSNGYTKVMLAIVARNIVNERMEELAGAGLAVERVAISSEGVCNWFRGAYPADIKLQGSQAIILLDVDSNFSDFIVIRKGRMVFTRNIFIGANHLTQEAAGWNEKFSDELKRSLERYQSLGKNVEIAKAYLSGSGPNIEGLDRVLAAALGVSVEATDQLKGFDFKNIAERPKDEDLKFVSMTPLLGLSAEDKETSIDLLPNEQKVRNMMEHKTKQLTRMGILVVAIVTVLSSLYLTNVYTKNAYLAKLKKTISQIASEAEGIDKMRAVINKVEERLDSHGSSLEFLNEIYRVTPREIYLTDIDIDEKQSVGLKGSGFAMSDVFKYVKILEESEMFENVKTTYTRIKRDKDSEFAEFEINCIYQK